MSELRTNRIVPRDGLPSGSSGGIIQVKMGTFTDRFTTNSATMGDNCLSVSITPTRADSKILVNVSLGSFANGTGLKRAFMNIVRDSTNVIVGDADTGHEVTACVNTRASGYASGTQIPLSFILRKIILITPILVDLKEVLMVKDLVFMIHLKIKPY